MAVVLMETVKTYTGVHADTKPSSVPVGSRFFETDTQDSYVLDTDGTTWVIDKSIFGGEL